MLTTPSSTGHVTRRSFIRRWPWAAALLGLVVACGNGSAPVPSVQVSEGAKLANAGVGDVPDTVRAHAYLESFYATSDILHSFNTVFGEEIDCIDFYAQPVVKEALARGDSVSPNGPPPGVGPELPSSTLPLPFDGQPDENGHARRCPAGSVPAHRPTLQTIEVAGGLDAFLAYAAKVPSPSGAPGEQAQLDCFDNYTTGGVSYDHAAGYQYQNYQGLLTFTPTYNPYVEVLNAEHSVSQLWAETGNCEYDTARPPSQNPCNSSDWVQSLELGLDVGANPFSRGGGAQIPMLFTFVTLNGYYSENCWGMIQGSYCGSNGGFVQVTGANYVPGSYMTYTGTGVAPIETALQVWNGSAYGYPYWFVYVNGNLIGYYYGSMYAGQMQSSASYLQVGGEVFDSWPNNAHTNTLMGGGYVSGGWEFQGYDRHVSYIDSSNAYHNASLGYVNSNTGICGYEASSYYDLETNEAAGPLQTQWGSTFDTWNTYFYFGGNLWRQ